MKRTLIALVAAAALLTLVSPAMAQSKLCSFLGQVSEVVGGAVDGVIANNCSTPPASSAVAGSGSPTVATSEPLIALSVGLGLLGARLLRRR